MTQDDSSTLTKTKLPDGRCIAHMNASETWLIYDEIFKEQIYDRGGVKLHDGATVIDVGGNIGLFLLYATDRYKNLRVFSFEPIPQTFRVLSENRKLIEGDHEIQLINAGIWRDSTQKTFRHLPRFSCSSTMCPDDSPEQQERALNFTLNAFLQHPNRWLTRSFTMLPRFLRIAVAKASMRYHAKSQSVSCRLMSPNDVFEQFEIERVDYFKLDAEGAEIDILESISEDQMARIEQIAVETHHGDETMQRVERILRDAGFTTQVSFSNSSPEDKMVYGTRRGQHELRDDRSHLGDDVSAPETDRGGIEY